MAVVASLSMAVCWTRVGAAKLWHLLGVEVGWA